MILTNISFGLLFSQPTELAPQCSECTSSSRLQFTYRPRGPVLRQNFGFVHVVAYVERKSDNGGNSFFIFFIFRPLCWLLGYSRIILKWSISTKVAFWNLLLELQPKIQQGNKQNMFQS